MTRSVTNLMLAVFLLEVGSGLQGVLVPIRGELAGFSTIVIGGLGTLYYFGFVAGCLALPATVRRVGHIRCFSALAAVAASVALLHALVVLPLAWMAFRVVFGFCFAGLFMVAESWLNEQATTDSRGRILGQYMVATWVGVIGGKLLFSEPVRKELESFESFVIPCVVRIMRGDTTCGRKSIGNGTSARSYAIRATLRMRSGR